MRKFEQIRRYYRNMLACLLFVLPFLFCTGADAMGQDTVRHSIYPQDMKNKSGLYNKLWGVHYRELYSTPDLRQRCCYVTSAPGWYGDHGAGGGLSRFGSL